MRPSLTLITATLAFAATAVNVANASPVANVPAVNAADVVERADAPAAVDVEAFARSSSEDLEARARKHHKKSKKKHHSHAKKGNGAKATFYTGDQLNAPACGDPTPSDGDMIAAVKQGGPFKCHDHITLSKGGKSVTVKVVDMCAGCEDLHIDLTKGAFKKLGKLSEGVLTGLSYST